MTSTNTTARQPKGIPTGGQFATSARAESDVSLAASTGQTARMDIRSVRVDDQIRDTQDDRVMQIVRISPAGSAGRRVGDGPIAHAKIVREDGTLSDFTADIWDGSMSYPSSRYTTVD